MDFDRQKDGCVRVDINVVFQPLGVRRGNLQTYEYYVGTTAVNVLLEIEDGRLKETTEDAVIPVDYKNTSTGDRKAALSLEPKVTQKMGDQETAASAGKVSFAAGSTRGFEASYRGGERILVKIGSAGSVSWELKLPKGAKIAHGYLLGNLVFYGVGCWSGRKAAGKVVVHPRDVRLFNADSERIDGVRALLMRMAMWKQGITMPGGEDIAVEFKEIGHE
jgi:hypothetical protein